MDARPLVTQVVSPILVGRDAHLNLLNGLAEKVKLGQGQTILVAGEAGIGKTRLVAEFKRRVREAGWLVFQGNCFEPDSALPYAPWVELLRDFYRALPPGEREPAITQFAPDLLRLVPEIARDLGGPASQPALAPDQEKRRIFQAIAGLLAGGAVEAHSSAPLVAVIEDLHWSDDTSLELSLHLARRLARRPVLLLLTYRDEDGRPGLENFLAQVDRERLATELFLTRLSRDEVGVMIRAIFGLLRPAPGSFLDALHELTDGNPFFVEEVLKSLATAGALHGAGGRWNPKPVQDLNVPRSVKASVQQRVARVSHGARQSLLLAAVAGRRFGLPLLAEVTRMSEDDMEAHLKELIDAQLLVEESADVFSFRHELTREAVYSTLLRRERQRHHRAVAEAHRRLGAGSIEAHLADLGYHYFYAGDWAEALEYSRQAGDRAQSMYAPREAQAQYTRALEAAARVGATASQMHLYRARGQAYETAGDFDRARADYEAALSAARAAPDQKLEWQGLLDLGFLWSARDYARTAEYFQQALHLARRLGDPVALAHTLNRVGNWHVNVDQPYEAFGYHEEALAVFQGLDDRGGLAETFDLLGLAADERGDYVQSVHYYEQAISLMHELDDRQGLSSSLAVLASRFMHYYADLAVLPSAALEEIAPQAAEALQIARSIGWRAGEAFSLMVAGSNRAAAGEYGAALESAERGLEIARAIGHRQWECLCSWGLAAVFSDLLMPAQAEAYAESALSQAREVRSLIGVRLASGLLALAHLQQNDVARADAVLESVVVAENDQRDSGVSSPAGPVSPAQPVSSPAPSPPAPGTAPRRAGFWAEQRNLSMALRVCRYAEAVLALAGGDPPGALQIVDALIASAPNIEAFGQGATPRLALLRAEALVQLGRVEEAVLALEAALDHARRLGLRPLLWRIHSALGRLYSDQSRHPEAESELAEARNIIDQLAATIPDDRLQAAFKEQALAAIPPPRMVSPREAAKRQFGGLTARERQVAALIARGMSNRDVAASLVLSERTVETHVTRILTKLDLTSRTQIANWARDSGLVAAAW